MSEVTVEREGDLLVIRVPMEFKRQSGRKVIIVPDGTGHEGKEHKKPSALLLAVARAFSWQDMLDSGNHASLEALADSVGLDRSYVGRMLKLACLSPRIVESILRREEPGGLSVDEVAKNVPLEWGTRLAGGV